ncbi:MAG TPA: peroxiredoxin [Acidimicrobiia bacterium]
MSGPAVGDPAPDFTLPGVEKGVRRDFTLSDYRGRKVALAFYPGDATPGCSIQLKSYRDDFEQFERAGAVVLAISPQDVESKERWCEREHFEFPLLADTDKKVIAQYGATSPIIGVKRSIFLIDTAGVVRWRFSGAIRAIYKRPSELGELLASIG